MVPILASFGSATVTGVGSLPRSVGTETETLTETEAWPIGAVRATLPSPATEGGEGASRNARDLPETASGRPASRVVARPGSSDGSSDLAGSRERTLGGAASAGGVGIVATGDATVTTRGLVSGGLGGDGVTRADAVAFSGGGNVVTLEAGYAFEGDVVSTSAPIDGDTLALGGAVNGTFDLTDIGDAARFRGFEAHAKTGPGTWTLTGDGAGLDWTVEDGTLLVDGTVGGVVLFGGVLGGDGTVGDIVLADGTRIAPGGSPGTLSGRDLEWNPGGSLDVQLGGTAGDSDRLDLAGELAGVTTLAARGSGGFVFHFLDAGGGPAIGTTYTLVTFATVSGFTVEDFSFDYFGVAPALNGHFVLTANALQFVNEDTVQAISFPNPGPQFAGTSFPVDPTATSGLPVTLVTATPDVCVVSGVGPFTLDFLEIGDCTLTASQPGNANWQPALPVEVTFPVRGIPVEIPTLGRGMLLLFALLLGLVGAFRTRSGASRRGGRSPA